MNPWGFLLTMTVILSGIAFGTFSVDRGGVEHLSIMGDLDEWQRQEIASLVAGLSSLASVSQGAKGSSNVAELKARFDEVDWIHHTNVMKDWPDGLIVEVIPEQVVAYWNDDAFISEAGKVLVTDLFIGSDLPYLYGPPGSEYQVMIQYQQLSRTLSGTEDRIEVLTLHDRGSWEFEIWNSLRVLLGREDVQQRMRRFLRVSQHLKMTGDLVRIDRMDARYANGVAVHYRPGAKRNKSGEAAQSELRIAELADHTGDRAYE